MTAIATDLAALTGTYAIDPAHSRLGFVARHAMVTKVRGAFNEFDGSAVIDGAQPSNSSVTITIKADSIDTRNSQRDEHLRSNDFFDLATYPTLNFASTAIAQTGEAEFQVTGDLTIKGTTKSVSFPLEFNGAVTDPWGNTRIGLEGSVVVNRKDWGLNWNTALDAGGVLVSEKVTLEFEISAVRTA
jgi:polyisoprenoid-binding protein YceI